MRYVFIGGGHLAGAFIAGLINSGCDAWQINVVDINVNRLQELRQQYQVNCETELATVLQSGDLVVLAVRPEHAVGVLQQLAQLKLTSMVLLSCVAGLELNKLKQHLTQENYTVIRAMPNLCALVGASATGAYCESTVSAEHKYMAERALRAIGTITWLAEESMLHLVTALSGSGPGYLFRMMTGLINGAKQQGLTEEQARFLVVNTFLGAAKIALESNNSLSELCSQVCVPGGTTEQAVNWLDKVDIDKIFEQMLALAADKSKAITNLI